MIRTLLVDDEPRAIKVLKLLLEKHAPEVEIIGTANDIKEAFKLILEVMPDLVFLDINMPKGSGLELLERVQKFDFKVIFTTAYQEHAIEALRLSALDYLLKPIDKSELVRAIDRYFKSSDFSEKNLSTEPNRITINSIEGLSILNPEDIFYIQSDKNYSIFHTSEESIVASKSLGHFEESLGDSFLRIHRSYIVNLNQIKHFKKGKKYHVVLADGTILEVSKGKKDELLRKLS